MRHEMLTQRALFCHRANAKRGTLSQHFVMHVVPPLPHGGSIGGGAPPHGGSIGGGAPPHGGIGVNALLFLRLLSALTAATTNSNFHARNRAMM